MEAPPPIAVNFIFIIIVLASPVVFPIQIEPTVKPGFNSTGKKLAIKFIFLPLVPNTFGRKISLSSFDSDSTSTIDLGFAAANSAADEEGVYFCFFDDTDDCDDLIHTPDVSLDGSESDGVVAIGTGGVARDV
uniref:Uncharacterized protein n=1 Tax=Romanomermis culicivorax TaxID=13658 RepID=A0A915IGR0_ROMCU